MRAIAILARAMHMHGSRPQAHGSAHTLGRRKPSRQRSHGPLSHDWFGERLGERVGRRRSTPSVEGAACAPPSIAISSLAGAVAIGIGLWTSGVGSAAGAVAPSLLGLGVLATKGINQIARVGRAGSMSRARSLRMRCVWHCAPKAEGRVEQHRQEFPADCEFQPSSVDALQFMFRGKVDACLEDTQREAESARGRRAACRGA